MRRSIVSFEICDRCDKVIENDLAYWMDGEAICKDCKFDFDMYRLEELRGRELKDVFFNI
jgi:hypothetical protein